MDAKEKFEEWKKDKACKHNDCVKCGYDCPVFFKHGYHSRDEEVRLLKYQIECHKEAINILPSTVDAIYKNKELKELLKKTSFLLENQENWVGKEVCIIGSCLAEDCHNNCTQLYKNSELKNKINEVLK